MIDTTSTNPTTVIFDLGNVVVRWDPRKLYRTLFPATAAGESEMEDFLANVIPLHTFNRRIDLGESAQEVCDDFVRANPTVDPALIYAYHQRWPEMLGPVIAETVEMLRALRARGIRCYALSNWGQNFVPACDLFPVLQGFDGRVVSFEVGVVKPNPEIFTALMTKFDLQAKDCLFVDDSTANISTAKQLGMRTHHFTHFVGLRAALDRHGLLPITLADHWDATEQRLRRTIQFADFNQAWAYMTKVAELAVALDHHPDWSNSYNSVTIELATHSKGRVTHLDRALAYESDNILRALTTNRT